MSETANVYIRLRGGRAERFEQIHDEIEERLGYRPTKTEAQGIIMAAWDIEEGDPTPLLEQ